VLRDKDGQRKCAIQPAQQLDERRNATCRRDDANGSGIGTLAREAIWWG
jgi:hypothetical protein